MQLITQNNYGKKAMDKLEDIHNLIAAELLKLNCGLLQRELEKRGQNVSWVGKAKQICVKEIRANPIQCKASLKGSCAFIWSWIRQQNISTREVFMLLVKWLLEIKASVFTQQFDDLCSEFGSVIEQGYNNETDISGQEIQDEWFSIIQVYYPAFKELIKELLTEDGLLEAA